LKRYLILLQRESSMADKVIAASIHVATGDAYPLAGGDTLLVLEGVDVSTSADGSVGISTDIGASNAITIRGSVYGFAGIQSSNANSTITIGSTGIVTGSTYGLSLPGLRPSKTLGRSKVLSPL
jgi:hypothetical protein